MKGLLNMSNIKVNKKNVRLKGNVNLGCWILLAEDAERDAAKALQRGEQFSQAARIFKENAKNGVLFPLEAATRN
jgi:hypothetical protein